MPLIYNMDCLPDSDHSQSSNLSVVAAVVFGHGAHAFMDEYTRQKERHSKIFEDIIFKYENMKESGHKIRLSEIPDRRKEKKEKSKRIKKGSYDIKKGKEEKGKLKRIKKDSCGIRKANKSRKPLHVTKVSEISGLSTAGIDLVKMKIKSANVTKVAKILDLSTAGCYSAQKKSKPASITKVQETSDLSVASINSELNVGTENWNEELPMCTEYGNQVMKETGSKKESLFSYASLEDSIIKPKLNVDKSSRKEDVPGNQSLKKSRFKKGNVPFLNTGENLKYVNNVNKASVNTLAKSWNSNNRFKKYPWEGITICPLRISQQTSPRSALITSPVSGNVPFS